MAGLDNRHDAGDRAMTAASMRRDDTVALGAPVHIGKPEGICIRDTAKPVYGGAVMSASGQ
jgi:uncharacterized protein YcsI (UPF0317 family)